MLEEYLVVLLIIFILGIDKKRIICYIKSIVNKKVRNEKPNTR